ncbi:MAG: DUF935 family protein, partial [Limisphaerales bacterium]
MKLLEPILAAFRPAPPPLPPILAAPARRPAGGDLQRALVPQAAPAWTQWLQRDYTPDRIEQTLRGALAGNHVDQWELFHLMEDTWPRLAKNLSEVKRAVAALDWQVQPWAEDDAPPAPEADARARALSRALWTMRPRPGAPEADFPGLIRDVLDAWGKGSVVIELDWEQRRDPVLGALWCPRAARWVEPRAWSWSPEGAIMLRADALRGGPRGARPAKATELVPFPPHKFIVGICRARTAHPLAAALLRPLAWWWCCANFSGAWLLNLAQIFGLPLRWATYDPARPGLLAEIADMMENLGSAGWGVFPQGTALEIKEATKPGGATPQDSLLDRADRNCDLLILGQTLTTDVGASGSLALGEVHKSVRDDVVLAAAEWAADVLTQQLAGSFCELNWGGRELCPELNPQPHKAEDRKARAETLAVLSGLGMQIPRDWAHETFEVPLPAEGDDVLERPEAMPAGGASDARPGDTSPTPSEDEEEEDEDEEE